MTDEPKTDVMSKLRELLIELSPPPARARRIAAALLKAADEVPR